MLKGLIFNALHITLFNALHITQEMPPDREQTVRFETNSCNSLESPRTAYDLDLNQMNMVLKFDPLTY